MDQTPQPDIASFVLRFVQESNQGSPSKDAYRGFIRHIQSDKEFAFTHWNDAVNFIRQFVSIDSRSGI